MSISSTNCKYNYSELDVMRFSSKSYKKYNQIPFDLKRNKVAFVCVNSCMVFGLELIGMEVDNMELSTWT